MRILAMVLTLACAGCGRESDPEARQPANTAQQQSYGERVAALSDTQRRAVFLRAIRDAGLDCQHVGSASAAGRYRGLPVWQATCRGGSVWTIVITDGGTAQILNASEARLVTDESDAPSQPAQ